MTDKCSKVTTPKELSPQTTSYNQEEAAKYLGVSTGLLKKKRLDGDGPAYCRIGKRVIYLKQFLDTYLHDKMVGTTGR